MQKIVVSASSLPAGRNMSSQIEYLRRVTTYGADMYHLDVMDGEYTKFKSIDYKYFDQLRENSPILFDAHLMIKDVDKIIDKYMKSPANIITIHYEVFDSVDDLKDMLVKIRKSGKLVGLAIDLDTDIKVIEPILKFLDMVLIMSVKAGKGGQEFSKVAINKIKFVRSLSKDILISVDGGINDTNAKDCVKAGADILCAGSFIYNNDTFIAIQKLKGNNG